ncbi:glycosyltransferase [Mongoliitalea daihaiensis]|uniref:glycosyltransferase n=1 Tax=Mongoliitalea daihaiensis TaxID=2782006 RepID=UPI001F1D805D|nr:glycosyltransferase [Mongoliitalea daihaiensis]UJP64167.1 glycosyltransferase [Mongoliitalea daihaiensis]
MENKFFAGFIITYNRAEILKNTIEKVFEQSLAPQKLWIIDNSEDTETEQLIKSFENFPLVYFRMDYNAGPAGAAAKGLELVANEDYDWIYWGDDNDPPVHSDTFQNIFKTLEYASDLDNIGQLGLIGHLFDGTKGVIKRIDDPTLCDSSFVFVDTIAGGQFKIINKAVVNRGILPASFLFYGQEELEFDLRLKKHGFKSIVNSELFYQTRKLYNRNNIKTKVYENLNENQLFKQYYSTRNLLYILKSNKYYLGFLNFLFKSIAKLFIGFRFGISYGILNFKYVGLGIIDFFRGSYGQLKNE